VAGLLERKRPDVLLPFQGNQVEGDHLFPLRPSKPLGLQRLPSAVRKAFYNECRHPQANSPWRDVKVALLRALSAQGDGAAGTLE